MSAVITPCGRYRLRLDRVLNVLDGPTIGFCLHNPSTADAYTDDRTLIRGISFARSWGASRLVFINPWAGRATKPTDLWQMSDPIGPGNDQHIVAAAAECAASHGFMVVAWGAIKPPMSQRMAAEARLKLTVELIRQQGCSIQALGLNANGSPKHPLYVPGDTKPLPWQPRHV